MRFDELGLAPELLRAISEEGYTEPTPIQAQAIPIVLSGKDLMGGAQTGTGKTAAFTLPLLQRILPFASPSPSPARHPVRILMLAPTRELAIQVYESVKTYSKYTPMRCLCTYGGVDIKPQIAEIRQGVEILVATPGRLLDLVEQKCLNFNSMLILLPVCRNLLSFLRGSFSVSARGQPRSMAVPIPAPVPIPTLPPFLSVLQEDAAQAA